MKRNVCEEKGGKVPEAKVGRCIRSKEKGLLDKYDGLATAAGSETRPRYTHTHTHTHTCKSIIRKRVSPKTRHRVP